MATNVPAVLEQPLVDGHCHLVYRGAPDRSQFLLWCTEADQPAPAGASYADTQLVLALRRWCAPALGLEPRARLDDYLDQRARLDPEEVRRRLLRAANLAHLLVDTGLFEDGFCRLQDLDAAAAAPAEEVVRLETVAEQVTERMRSEEASAEEFADAYAAALAEATRSAIGVKSVIAYRYGLDIAPDRPTLADVRHAARRWLTTVGDDTRLRDPVLLRFCLWSGLDTGLPVQLHTGFGDRDLHLPRANPALLQPFLHAAEPTGVPIVLLHCYPYHREAGWLAAVFPNVYVDIGLTVSHIGLRASSVLAEFCELAPFGKILFSTDTYGLPELYCVGATQFRHSFGELLTSWWRDGSLSTPDLERIGRAVGSENARRVYGL